MKAPLLKLPAGWKLVRLASVTTPSTEKATPDSFSDTRYIGLEHIESGTTRIIEGGEASSLKSAKTVFRAGDILYGKLRPYLNKACIPEFDGVCSTDILVFSKIDHLDSRYLLYFLTSPSTVAYATEHSSGINLPRVNAKTLGNIAFPLAPLSEQRRVVAKVESLQERSLKARRALTEVRRELERLRCSLLAAAFRGDLTTQWRERNRDNNSAATIIDRIRADRNKSEDHLETGIEGTVQAPSRRNRPRPQKEGAPLRDFNLTELPAGWCWAALEQLAEVQLGQRRAPEFAARTKFPYIRAGNITWDGLDLGDVKSMGFSYPESLFLEDGDVLLNEASGSKLEVGKPAIWRNEIPNCCFQATVIRVRSRSEFIRPEWIYYSRLHDAKFGRYATHTPGIGILHLTATLLRRWPVPLAPLSEQDRIVSLLRGMFDQLRALETYTDTLHRNLDSLDQAILSKAFRGELVPQDSNDEPASHLVKAIRKDRLQQMKKTTEVADKPKSPKEEESATDRLREWCSSQKNAASFTFEDFARDIPVEYDELKEALFKLLDERSTIEQLFDETSGTICFKRIKT